MVVVGLWATAVSRWASTRGDGAKDLLLTQCQRHRRLAPWVLPVNAGASVRRPVNAARTVGARWALPAS